MNINDKQFDVTHHTNSNNDVKVQENITEIYNEKNNYKQQHHNSIKFGFNDIAGVNYVAVINNKTNEIIRQIPSEEFFKNIKYFKEEIQPGLFINLKI